MSTFQVPQFIEEAPKIVGPLTLPQFLYFVVAGGISFISFYTFSFFLWFVISFFVAGAAAALAFGKVNGQSLPRIAQAALSFVWQPRIFTWQRIEKQTTIDIGEIENIRQNIGIGEKLKSLALAITTKKSALRLQGEDKTKYQTVVYLTGERVLAKKVDY